jgi:phosphopantothenoylcysteine decarboxylase/phosphopantothenate--cysteine ligase
MGVALAAAALERGAEVILISAAGRAAELRCEQVAVTSADEMLRAVMEHLPLATMVFMAAAVADYRVAEPAILKRKKTAMLTLPLVATEDILRRVVRERRPGTLVVGFAAETHDVLGEARRKLREKGVDAMVANDVSRAETGFESEENEGVLIMRDEEIALPRSSKRVMAERMLDGLARATARMRREVGVMEETAIG